MRFYCHLYWHKWQPDWKSTLAGIIADDKQLHGSLLSWANIIFSLLIKHWVRNILISEGTSRKSLPFWKSEFLRKVETGTSHLYTVKRWIQPHILASLYTNFFYWLINRCNVSHEQQKSMVWLAALSWQRINLATYRQIVTHSGHLQYEV